MPWSSFVSFSQNIFTLLLLVEHTYVQLKAQAVLKCLRCTRGKGEESGSQ